MDDDIFHKFIYVFTSMKNKNIDKNLKTFVL